jgi:hypothetical protein
MEEDAVATWLIPSEFMDVNYGNVIKEFLLDRVELVRIHRFNPDDVQFKDALVSSAVICFKNKKSNKKIVNFSFGGTLNSPKEYKEIDKDVLKNETKWSRFPCCQQTSKKTSDHKIKDYFDVKRGIATGGNDFFILEESRIKELGLPFEFFRSILPSARHLKTTEIEADNFGEPLLPKRLYLLDCRLSEDTIYKNYPLLWKYLESGRLSVGNGYICKNRKCWYFQEQRESPLYICTYMGRQRNINNSAFKFIFNKSKAIISNTYLGLYPHKDFADFLNQNPELKKTVWQLLTNITPDNLHNEGRIYGGGLNKIEPKELLNVSIPFFENFIPEKLSRKLSRLF